MLENLAAGERRPNRLNKFTVPCDFSSSQRWTVHSHAKTLRIIRGTPNGPNVLPPLFVKVNPVTLLQLDVQPFAMVEISVDEFVVACCVTLDATTAIDVLEVHDWVLRYFGSIHGASRQVRISTLQPIIGSNQFVELRAWTKAPSPVSPADNQRPFNTVIVEAALDKQIRRTSLVGSIRQGVAVAAFIEGDLRVFLCIRGNNFGSGSVILNGHTEAIGAKRWKKRMSLKRRPESEKLSNLEAEIHSPRLISSDIVHAGVAFAYLSKSTYRKDSKGVFDDIPALAVIGRPGAGKTRSVEDAVSQLQTLGIYAARCDVEIILDETSIASEARICEAEANDSVDWGFISSSLHETILVAAATNGLVVLENFGAAVRTFRRLVTNEIGCKEQPHNFLQRGGAALRFFTELEHFSQTRECSSVSGVVVVCDEPLEHPLKSANSRMSDKKKGRLPYNLISPASFLETNRFQFIFKLKAADQTAKAAVCATRLDDIYLEMGTNSGSIGLRVLQNSAGYMSSAIATAVDAAIMIAAARAVRGNGTMLRWSDIAKSLGVTCDFENVCDNSQWRGVWGCQVAKRELEKVILWPQTLATEFKRFSLRTCRGIVLYGPPGNGKTLLARAVADEIKAVFLNVQSAELLRPYLGESEAAIRNFFTIARDTTPTLLFFDELDAIGNARGDADDANGSTLRSRLVATLLNELDGVLVQNEGIVSCSALICAQGFIFSCFFLVLL